MDHVRGVFKGGCASGRRGMAAISTQRVCFEGALGSMCWMLDECMGSMHVVVGQGWDEHTWQHGDCIWLGLK